MIGRYTLESQAEKELHGTFTIPGITKKLEKLKAEQNEF